VEGQRQRKDNDKNSHVFVSLPLLASCRQVVEEEEEEEGEEESLFKADAVNEEDPERDRAAQV